MTQPVFFTLIMLTHLGSLSNMTRVKVDPVLPYQLLNSFAHYHLLNFGLIQWKLMLMDGYDLVMFLKMLE
ncbi:hypothetical protein OUZ56_017553 [Daphnia magna]|uniref:Uncharacterized protein n=1 Tax=Daphnia magna TaxID=35525 RepID=A0ABR0ATJ6_9CRUS|nr:hypothetical protein OUZ56_017553 [Daphnia magna]